MSMSTIGRKLAFGAVMMVGASLLGSAAFAQATNTGGEVAAGPPPAPIEGVWLTKGKTQITISPCGNHWCGYISKVVIPPEIKKKYGDDIAKLNGALTDQLNEDPSLRSRPILGMKMLTLSAGSSAPTSYDISVYNPQDGKTYGGYMQVLNHKKIRLNGCVMYNTICQGEDWTRIAEPATAGSDGTAASGSTSTAD